MSPHRSSILATLVLILPLLLTAPARAQFGGAAGFADAFRPDFLDRDMPLFVEHLKLEDWQRPIIEMLLLDYTHSFEAGIERVKNEMRDAQTVLSRTDPDKVMEIILEPITRWDADRRVLRDEFLLNIRGTLSADQIARWPRFERTLRREKELPKGELNGESVDLYSIIRSQRLPYAVEETVDPLLEQYELELDAALEARRQRIDSLQDGIKEAMANMDFDAGLDATDSIMLTRVNVRAVQDRWIEVIAEALPEDHSKTFRRNALERGYPKAFRPTAIPRLLESVRQLPDLTEAQISELESIESEFLRSLAMIETRIVETIRLEQPKEARRKVERMIARRNGETMNREANADDKIIAEKNDLVDETRRRILAVLTPEQTGELPGGVTPRLPGGREPGIGDPQYGGRGESEKPGKNGGTKPSFQESGKGNRGGGLERGIDVSPGNPKPAGRGGRD
jgi:Spy/CpxP family protein refolding chaperone